MENKLLDLSAGDVLLHHKSGQKYVVLDADDHYFSEYYDPDNPDVSPLEVPMVHYQALYGDRKKWFRPRTMFTEQRFSVVDNVFTNYS